MKPRRIDLLFRSLLVALPLVTSAAGCGIFRGIPTHGGGKRFDEEQRVVAASIRRTLADLDLSELRDRKTLITIECVAQDGGGTVIFPGLSNIHAGVSGNVGEGNFVQIVPIVPQGSRTLSDNENTSAGGNVGMNYNTNMTYSPAAMGSGQDLAYLKAALEMKARHAGVALVAAEPEVVLHVLVDVLGTNRSRTDNFVNSTETLTATVECTYYAVDAKSGQLVFRARRAASSGTYREHRALGVDGAQVARTITRITPTPMPVDEESTPSTQPAMARKRKRGFFDFARVE